MQFRQEQYSAFDSKFVLDNFLSCSIIICKQLLPYMQYISSNPFELFNYSHHSSYKETVKRMSAIFHDRPMRPVEKAAFWIEHVIKHGGEYMRSPIHDLTWYQYYLLDVVAFLLLVLVVVFVFIMYSCKFAFRCCKRVLVGKKAKTD